MNPAAAKRLRLLASVVSILLLLGVAAAGWFYSQLRRSRPQLDGTAQIPGLSASVTVERDALGVPTIRGKTRTDVARALGWLHAQDRFFQMDALRRTAAGELSEIIGPRTLASDRATRLHGFRALAQKVVATLPADHRDLLDAYTAGVNAGLAALATPPFEYVFLRADPSPWRSEDTILVAYAMTLELQDETGSYEKTLMTLRDQFGPEGVAFFAPLVTPGDAALDGSTAPLPPIPGPKMLDLRARQAAQHAPRPTPALAPSRDPEVFPGSNAFALSGARTASGAALLANDMHLDHRIPNTWYRAVFEWPASGASASGTIENPASKIDNLHRLVGVTLPGVPLLISGSNGRIAWGFTASYIDTSDLIVVENAPGLTTYYMTPAGQTRYETRTETIRVKGEDPVTVEYRWTIWGPIIGQSEADRPLALRWIAHDPAATNLGLIGLETVTDAASAVDVAHRAGMPAQNILIADTGGAIAWTIAGAVPKRTGYDGRLPTAWAYGDRSWDGFLAPNEIPTLLHSSASADGAAALWSANQRHVGGDALAKLGDGGYARPHRGGMIRDRLAEVTNATPRDLLDIQLDDRATFLAPWHQLLLDTLTPEVMAQKGPRAALRPFAEQWTGHASVDSVGHPIAKQFRAEVRARVFSAIFASCVEANPAFDWRLLDLEPALWALLREKPAHLLNPEFATWDDLLVAAVDDVIGFLDQQAITMPNATWGRANTVHIRHPFSYSLPDWLTRSLDMPPTELPGDTDMPRVQRPQHGASERLVVSPGRESEAIFHMPGGQSAHPLSPFYRAGHDAWARGEPTPLLPGKTQHTLTLTP